MATKKEQKTEPAAVADEQPIALNPPGGAVTLTSEQFQMLIDSMKTGKQDDGLLQTLATIAKSSERTAEEFKRQVRRSNKVNMDDRNPFAYEPTCALCQTEEIHPETGSKAHPKEGLKYDVFFCDGMLRADWLSPLEVRLCNSFEKNMECRDGRWKAVFDQNGTRRRLFITVPYRSMDERIDLPPFAQILTELLYGQVVADPSLVAAELAALRERIKELESNAARGATVGGPPMIRDRG